MKKAKRKYTRKVVPNAPELKSSPIKEESNSNVLSEFKFKDLPLSLRMEVEAVIKWRNRVGLPDDSKERIERAIKMFRGDKLR